MHTVPDHARNSHDDWLSRFPDNVLVEVFEAVARISKRDLCHVSRLNKRYHVLADAVLYKTVHFLTPELHFIFSESLTRRPRRGSAIYEAKLAYPASELSRLAVQAPNSPNGRDTPWPFDGLSRTISTMSNLETLDVAVPDTLLHGIGKLFDSPFDLACLKSCTLFYQTEDDQYWDLQENIHIFAHPTLETLIIRRAKLDHRGFDLIERPHETALSKLHLIECDINDDALSDLLMFPQALKEFVMTQTEDPSPELEESSDSIRDYVIALDSACHSLETVTIDFPLLQTSRPLALRDFTALKTLRINWDHQLFGKTSKKPRLQSVGLPPELETLEFFNKLGTDEEVTDLFVLAIQNLHITARKLTRLIVSEGDDDERIPREIEEACKLQEQLELDIIGRMDTVPVGSS
ncbi:hypothetical protein AK830_g7304 [Neonectria ditissima]|uniref:F-box domain-containing protein n=1 Tax=Neonectria ditissima TaxID=78410 RepID=A0A0P7BGI1_9HYPO|nr:hypothetical protein AK830_g7304 [Neonectria ditissima]